MLPRPSGANGGHAIRAVEIVMNARITKAEDGQRAATQCMGFSYQIHDSRLPVSILLENCRLARRSVWHHLPPVKMYELLRDSVDRQLQGCAGVVALLDAQNRKRKQQSELLRRSEQSLI